MTKHLNSRKKTQQIFLVLLFSSLLVKSLPAFVPISSPLIAVKVYQLDQSVDETIKQWRALHINAIFAPQDLLESCKGLRERLTKEGMSLFLITPVFYNPQALKADPSLFAIRQDGSKAIDDWVEFVCPANLAYRQRRVDEIVKMCELYQPEVISLDFIRYFAFWEMNSPDSSPKESDATCYCPTCLNGFCTEKGITRPTQIVSTQQVHNWLMTNHADAWQAWKIKQINDTVDQIVAAVKKIQPNIRFNLHLVPWRHSDFNQAALKMIAQDVAALSQKVDFISPMCYSHMVKRPASWIHDFCTWLATQIKKPILPSIQVAKAYGEDEPTLKQFADTIEQAWAKPSAGIVFWNWENFATNPQKQEIFRKFIGKTKTEKATKQPDH